MKMTREDFNEMISYMIDILREADDGDSTCTALLCEAAGYEEQDIEPYNLDDVHMALFEAAEDAGIELDMSAHDFKFEGLQYSLDFVIHNNGAQYKCPHCGSTNTARILYGMPAFDDDLQSKLNSGKVVLGGCLIQTIEKDGQTIIVNPDRKCNDCGTEFSCSDNGIDADVIAEEIIELLGIKETGTVTTTARLAEELGYSRSDYKFLFDVHNKVFKLAEKNGLTLDMSGHEDMEQGLPFNLEFSVYPKGYTRIDNSDEASW